MTDEGTIYSQIEDIRKETIAILEDLTAKAHDFQLPEIPDTLRYYRLKLIDNTYKVLLVGEAKRGKTSFVNALIGRDILPTDVDVATSEVFQVRRSQHEAYRVRFEDGSAQEITATNLPHYGSQMISDIQGMPRLNQIIRWIEVDVPATFLPKGMSILDTPGLGSLYANYAQITQRFVPLADAVIFVLDSSRPMGEFEIQFLDNILSVTQHIFFIQTKIDQYDKEHWQQIQQRNEVILKERFKERLTDAHVWPISSIHLMKATQTNNEVYLKLSRYKQLASALQLFLFRVAGWTCASEAILIAGEYQTDVRKTLAGRLATLTEKSEQKRNELRQHIHQRKLRFDEEWGVEGEKRHILMTNIHKVIDVNKQSFLGLLQLGGDIEMTQRWKIDALKTYQEAQEYSKVIDGEVISAVLIRWKQTCQQAQGDCIALLDPFLTAADSVGFSKEGSSLVAPIGNGQVAGRLGINEKAGTERIGDWFIEGFFVPGVATTLAALVWSAMGIRPISSEIQFGNAKKRLYDRLSQVLQDIRQRFLSINIETGYYNLVDGYFASLERILLELIQKKTIQQSAEAQAELDRLSEQAKLDEHQRRRMAEQFRRQLAEWDAINLSISAIAKEVREVGLMLLSSGT